jgi:hypothetical protein
MIRFLDEAEVVLQRQVRSDIARDAYWREIAAQRGGEDVAFKWSRSVSNGYAVRGAIPKGARLAHVGPER